MPFQMVGVSLKQVNLFLQLDLDTKIIVAELVKVSAPLVYSYTNQRSRDCIPFILFHSKDYFTVVNLDLLVSPRPDHTYFIFLPQSIMLFYYNE